MKKFVIAVLVAMMLCLTGCGSTNLNVDKDNNARFESTTGGINDIYTYDIIVDNETGFQYLIFNNGRYQSMTQMIGADGKPIVAETYGE